VKNKAGWIFVGVATYLGFSQFPTVHVIDGRAIVIVINLAGDCEVRIPPSQKGQRILCREVPDYLQNQVKLPLGSVFGVVTYNKLPREPTDAVIAPLTKRGYQFGLVMGPVARGPGYSPGNDHPTREE
jgi:hypothetical protein